MSCMHIHSTGDVTAQSSDCSQTLWLSGCKVSLFLAAICIFSIIFFLLLIEICALAARQNFLKWIWISFGLQSIKRTWQIENLLGENIICIPLWWELLSPWTSVQFLKSCLWRMQMVPHRVIMSGANSYQETVNCQISNSTLVMCLLVIKTTQNCFVNICSWS